MRARIVAVAFLIALLVWLGACARDAPSFGSCISNDACTWYHGGDIASRKQECAALPGAKWMNAICPAAVSGSCVHSESAASWTKYLYADDIKPATAQQLCERDHGRYVPVPSPR